ncbi:MAG: endonuclease III domain-containing protein, partial [Candidatus Woesearchaeota archaeon]
YAGRKPIFVIDAYTKRICAREGICKPDVEYHELQEKFHKQLPPNHKLYNEFHALFVEEGKRG